MTVRRTAGLAVRWLLVFLGGALALFYPLWVMIYLRFYPALLVFPAFGILLIVTGLFWDKRRKIPILCRIVLISLSSLFLMSFCVFVFKVVRASRGPVPGEAKWVVVVSTLTNGESPSDESEYRLANAAKCAWNNPEAMLVLTGGTCGIEAIPDSVVSGYDLMIRYGLPEERLLSETESASAEETISLAGKLIRENGGKSDDPVAVFCSDFHIYHAEKLMKREGFTSVSFYGSHGRAAMLPYYYVNEFIAEIGSWLGLR